MFEARRPLYHLTLGLRVIKKKKVGGARVGGQGKGMRERALCADVRQGSTSSRSTATSTYA